MTPRSASDVRLRDPLSAVTRNERKILLAASAIGLIVRHAGLVPKRIAAFGIEFSEIDQTVLLRSMAVIVAYFLCAFVLYAISDLVAWRFEFHSARREGVLDELRKHRDYEALEVERKRLLEAQEALESERKREKVLYAERIRALKNEALDDEQKQALKKEIIDGVLNEGRFKESLLELELKRSLQSEETGEARLQRLFMFSDVSKTRFLKLSEFPISLLRALFEFLLPPIIGLIAVIQLFRA